MNPEKRRARAKRKARQNRLKRQGITARAQKQEPIIGDVSSPIAANLYAQLRQAFNPKGRRTP